MQTKATLRRTDPVTRFFLTWLLICTIRVIFLVKKGGKNVLIRLAGKREERAVYYIIYLSR